jgi:hypothetical protein
MNRKLVKYWVDVGLVISFLVCFISGVIKIPVVLRYLDLRTRDLPIFQITQIHDWSGVILGILVVIHLALNWGWMVSMTRRLLSRE